MISTASASRAAAFALLLAASPCAANGPSDAPKASTQLETAETLPEVAYENAHPRPTPGAVDAGRGSIKGPKLSRSSTSGKVESDLPSYVVGEDRAVTQPPEKPGFAGSPWVWAGSMGILLAIGGFLAFGPWGILGGLLLGAGAGYLCHGFFH